MIKTPSSQQGFAHAFLITGLVVALVGALGFVFWQNFIYEEPNTKTETIVVTENKKVQKVEEPQLKSFPINEYNVEFKIPEKLSDSTIKYEARQIGEASFLAFTTQRVVSLGGDCAKGYPFGDLVTLSRDDQSKSDEYQVYTSEMIDGHYYHIGTIETAGLTPESKCPANKEAKSDLNSLVIALKSLGAQQ